MIIDRAASNFAKLPEFIRLPHPAPEFQSTVVPCWAILWKRLYSGGIFRYAKWSMRATIRAE
jgi:hypothetical protein